MKPIIGITADIEEGRIKLKREYVLAVAKAGGLPFIIAPASDVTGIADKIDGLVLSGGGDIEPEYYGETLSVPSNIFKPVERERIEFEIELFKKVMEMHKPILGICYGMQLVNVALGGTLYQDIDIQAGSNINHRQGQHKIKVVQPLAFSLQPSAYIVNSSHHQAVRKIGKGLEAFAVSEDGIVEGLSKKDYPFLVCVQWHPEMDFKKLSSHLFQSFIEASEKS